MGEKKYCIICGAELYGAQRKYCSDECSGRRKGVHYKTCPVCGKKFPEPAANQKICCSPECSSKHRRQQHESGLYDQASKKMHEKFSEKVAEIGPERHWISKHWVIESPSGRIYECDNLMNFIRENPDLFDGTLKQAFDGFQKIRASMEGKRKHPSKSWKGWHLISWEENSNRYEGGRKR